MVEAFQRIWFEQPLWIMWGTVAAYVLFIFSKGVAKVRKIDGSDDFLVAGRNVGWFFLFCTMGATVVGGGASIGAIGRTYDWGILMLLVSTGWYIHFIFAGLYVAPQFRRAKLYTVAGYFGHRFGEGPRAAALVLSLFFSIFVIAAQMAAFGLVLASALPNLTENLADSWGVSSDMILKLAIVVGGLLVVIYSTAGGLMAVIHTDIYQFIVLIGGFIITLLLIVPDLAANWGTMSARLPTEFLEMTGGYGWLFLITTFMAFLLGEMFAPGYATRYCIGRDVRNTKLGITGVGIFLALTFPVVLFFIAVYARLHFPGIEPQMALPLVIRELNNPLVAGIIIGALLSAVMSSADSALNSATAIFVKDLFEHQLKWKAEDRRVLKLARLFSAALGLLAIAIAAVWTDIIGLLLFTYHVWAPAMVLPVIFGIFSKERSPIVARQILVTMIATTVVTLLYRLTPYTANFDPAVFGVLLSAVIFFVLRNFWKDKPRSPEQVEADGEDDHTLAGTRV